MSIALDNPWRAARWAAIPAILLVPVVAMQLTTEVRWTLGDLAVAVALLAGVAVAYEGVLAFGASARTRVVAAVTVGTALLGVWAELAVGVLS